MNKLIFVLVIFTVIFNGYCDSKKNQRTKLAFKEGIKEAILVAIKRCNAGEKLPKLLKLIDEGSYGDDDFFKKFITCGYKESGYSFENGRVNINKAYKVFGDKNDEILKVMKECDKQTYKETNDPETNTYEFFKCYQDNTPYLLDL